MQTVRQVWTAELAYVTRGPGIFLVSSLRACMAARAGAADRPATGSSIGGECSHACRMLECLSRQRQIVHVDCRIMFTSQLGWARLVLLLLE